MIAWPDPNERNVGSPEVMQLSSNVPTPPGRPLVTQNSKPKTSFYPKCIAFAFSALLCKKTIPIFLKE